MKKGGETCALSELVVFLFRSICLFGQLGLETLFWILRDMDNEFVVSFTEVVHTQNFPKIHRPAQICIPLRIHYR
jgi:hypothetical protein